MSELDRMQRGRIRAANALTETFAEHRDAEDLGDRLVEAYLATGKGDEYDVTSNIIDIVADLGFALGRRGVDFESVVEEVRRGEASSPAAEMILSLRSAYREDQRGYEAGHSFNDLLRIGAGHCGFELADGDAADYGALPSR